MNLKEDYKMSNKFNKGDIVELVSDCYYNGCNVKIKKGTIGKVVNTKSIRYNKQDETILYGIDWGKNVNGHDIGGLTKYGYGYYILETDIELYNPDEPLLAR
jgi:hypothetical protein